MTFYQILRKEDMNLVDLKRLKEEIDDSGMTMVSFSAKTGMLRATLYKKLAGQSEFTISEVESISDVLRLNANQRNAIFFAKQVE